MLIRPLRGPHPWLAALSLILTCWTLPAAGQGVLDEVRGERGTAWLLGSLHFGSDDLYPLGDSIERAFAASDRLMVEVDLLAMRPEAVSELVARLGGYPEGDALRRHVSEHLWQRLVGTGRELGLPVEALSRQRPWLASLTVTSAFLQRSGLRASEGIDLHFLQRARRSGLPVLELESLESQLTLMHQIPDTQQALLLAETLAQVEQGHSVPVELLRAWREGDRDGLQSLLVSGLAATPAGRELARRLLDARNRPMAARIDEELQRGGTVFVVVGAAHLLGEGSVTAELRARGHSVTAR